MNLCWRKILVSPVFTFFFCRSFSYIQDILKWTLANKSIHNIISENFLQRKGPIECGWGYDNQNAFKKFLNRPEFSLFCFDHPLHWHQWDIRLREAAMQCNGQIMERGWMDGNPVLGGDRFVSATTFLGINSFRRLLNCLTVTAMETSLLQSWRLWLKRWWKYWHLNAQKF